MKAANAVLVALIAADGVVDKMELATDVFGSKEIADLTAYQASAADGTTDQEDLMFLRLFSEYINIKKGDRG